MAKGQGIRPGTNEEAFECIKYMLFSYNLLFFLCACAVLGTGIWLTVDRAYMGEITGEMIYPAAIYLMLAGGAIMFIVAFCACIGAVSENKTLLWIFFIVLCCVLFLLLIAAILAIAFSAQIGDAIKDTMTKTLQEHYGIDLYEDNNRLITKAWDKAQEKLKCCAVENEGWEIYRTTEWYKIFGPNEEIHEASATLRPYVPRSCCVRDRFHRYANLEVCQTWDMGPPRTAEGALNRALYYEGCFDAGKRSLQENSGLMIGFCLVFGLVVVAGLLLTWFMIRRLD